MRKKLFSFAAIAVVLMFVGSVFSGCTKDHYYTDYYDSTGIYQQFIDVKANNWTWSNTLSRYEVAGDLKGFNNSLYDDGAIVVSAFWVEDGTEIQTSLPYVRTWIDDKTNIRYTETISYEIFPSTNKIVFYIQNSDMKERTSSKHDYEFKFMAIKHIN